MGPGSACGRPGRLSALSEGFCRPSSSSAPATARGNFRYNSDKPPHSVAPALSRALLSPPRLQCLWRGQWVPARPAAVRDELSALSEGFLPAVQFFGAGNGTRKFPLQFRQASPQRRPGLEPGPTVISAASVLVESPMGPGSACGRPRQLSALSEGFCRPSSSSAPATARGNFHYNSDKPPHSVAPALSRGLLSSPRLQCLWKAQWVPARPAAVRDNSVLCPRSFSQPVESFGVGTCTRKFPYFLLPRAHDNAGYALMLVSLRCSTSTFSPIVSTELYTPASPAISPGALRSTGAVRDPNLLEGIACFAWSAFSRLLSPQMQSRRRSG